MLNDASWASFGFFNNNKFPNRKAKHINYTTQCLVIFLESTGLMNTCSMG